jgi:hypothetical protein
MTSPDPTTPQPRKRHRIRNTLGILAALIIGIIIAANAASGGSDPQARDSGTGIVSGGSSTPYSGSNAAPSPTANSGDTNAQAAVPAAPVARAKHVKFVITGYAPGGDYNTVDITYGSNNDTHDVSLPSLIGKAVYSVPFHPGAEYYSVDATYTGAGHLKVKIVITGTAMNPTTVSHGQGSGSGSWSDVMASAQAAPNNASGTQWMDES